MEISGRLTADATTSTVSGDRKVVNFTIAISDNFKTKSGERKEVTEFVRCAYWMSDKVAKFLTKGKIVALYGRISANAWTGSDGEARAGLDFYTANIKFLGGGSKTEQQENGKKTNASQAQASVETKDDLPF